MPKFFAYVSLLLFLIGLPVPGAISAQSKIQMTTVPLFTGLPASVVEYGEGKGMVLKKPALNGKQMTVSFAGTVDGPFTLVMYFAGRSSVVVIYVDAEKNFLLTDEGKVLFGFSSGLTITGTAASGTLSYKFSTSVNGVYRLRGKGTLFLFAVKGKVRSNSVLPGDQKDITAYQAVSNVVSLPYEFR